MIKACEIFLAVLICFFLFLLKTTIVSASVNHAHHQVIKINSPFINNSQLVRVHCAFDKHYLNRFCPHHLKKTNSEFDLISSNCGHPFSSKNLNESSIEKNVFSFNESSMMETQKSNYFFDNYFKLPFSFVESAKPPPKSLF